MLGAIADDLTGATDLAIMLRRAGYRTAVVVDGDGAVVDGGEGEGGGGQLKASDAVVMALKTRTAAPRTAVEQSLDALRRLRAWGAQRYYFKYCSTFDSTDDGNIGPVLDALADALGARRVVVVPSLPANGRTVRDGLLRVDGQLLENSSMRHHPLTPMTRSRVADLLRPQTARGVEEVRLATVRAGEVDLRRALDAASEQYVVVDAVDDDDLSTVAAAVVDDVLVSGGSGLALGMHGPHRRDDDWPAPVEGRHVVLCGSVSEKSRRQVADAARTVPTRQVDLRKAMADPGAEVAELASWVGAAPAGKAPVVCAARTAADVAVTVDGVAIAPLVEDVLSRLALRLVEQHDVTGLVVAGGETSGAVVHRLGAPVLHIGPELAPGVCWSAATTAAGRPVALALKSGNFGEDDLFTQAWAALA